MSDDRASATEVLDVDGWLPDGAIPVSAVVLVAYMDPESGEENLAYRRDNDASAWKHLGMLDVAQATWLDDCRRNTEDEP